MKSISKTSRKPGHNVVNLVPKKAASIVQSPADLAGKTAAETAARAGAIKSNPDDARVKEAMRLAQAFLAIEDPGARGALIALAERLISYDWIRKVK